MEGGEFGVSKLGRGTRDVVGAREGEGGIKRRKAEIIHRGRTWSRLRALSMRELERRAMVE